MNWEAFFTLHNDLPREGPGCPDDVVWACNCAQVPRNARILDAGCGPGADIPGLLDHAPKGQVLAVDVHAPFAAAVRAKYADDPRVRAEAMDMSQVEGPFDFIWSAGALYFLGVEKGLKTMAGKLASGGAIAFSHLTYLVDVPHQDVFDVFDNEPDVMGQADLRNLITRSGFDVLGQRILPNASWDAYNDPIRERIAQLRRDADDDLMTVLREAEAEIAMRDKHSDQFGYVLSVVRAA